MYAELIELAGQMTSSAPISCTPRSRRVIRRTLRKYSLRQQYRLQICRLDAL
jgi:hypothetical protein